MNFPKSKQIRGLVDCDSFYASCEIFHKPSLQGLPVCIGQDIVIARSYEAKPYGVKVGTPIREAKKMLPRDAVYLAPRMIEYGRISQRLMTYLSDKCMSVEQFSIDEAFIEMSGYQELYKLSYEDIAHRMKGDIKKKIGIPVSIGLGPTRLLGKIFAEINKPFGTCVALDEEHIDTILRSIPLGDIPFIGPKTQDKLAYRCTTAYDYKALPHEFVKYTLGRNGMKIWFELNGINATSFQPKDKPRAINRGRSFNPHFTNNKQQVRSHLMDNIDKAIEQLIDVGMKTKYIRLFFRSKDFKRFSVDKQLPNETADSSLIISIARELFDQIEFGKIEFRTTGITLGELVEVNYIQESLFTPPKKQLSVLHKASEAIHALNKKYGRGIIRKGIESNHHQKNTESFVGLEI